MFLNASHLHVLAVQLVTSYNVYARGKAMCWKAYYCCDIVAHLASDLLFAASAISLKHYLDIRALLFSQLTLRKTFYIPSERYTQ